MENVVIDDNAILDWLHGYCPVQAEGTVDGKPLYFRARGRRWRIDIGGTPVAEPEWGYGEPYGTGPFDAGWMSEDEALAFVVKAIALYRAGHPTTPIDLLVRQPQD